MSDAVYNLLVEKGLSPVASGKDYLIKCLNPKHEDSSPSLHIDKVSGVSHCFACGWKRNIFRHYGLMANTSSVRLSKLKQKILDIKESMTEVEWPKGHIPYTQPFRGLSVATLKHFGAFYTHEFEPLVDRVVFPILDITGKPVSFIGRHASSVANPKYKVYPSGKQLPTYPVQLEHKSNNIVLVEGIIDMMNMYDKGARNVVCVFGTQTLKSGIKSKLLPYKAQGVTKVFILFDGDSAGRDAADELCPLIEELDFTVEIISLPDDSDPGNLDKETINSIIEYTK